MYSITTFEWNGGPLKNIPIPAFMPEKDKPALVIKTLSIGVENNQQGFMKVAFALDNGSENYRGREYEFVMATINKLGYAGYTGGGNGGGHDITFNPTNGEPLTETMMKKYLLLFKLCGMFAIAPPRLVQEAFTGTHRRDYNTGSQIPYGTKLMQECLRDQLAATT